MGWAGAFDVRARRAARLLRDINANAENAADFTLDPSPFLPIVDSLNGVRSRDDEEDATS